MLRVTRVARFYNIPAREAQPARDGKPAIKARSAQKGVFDAGKTWVFGKLILRNPDDPLIPGTPVKRLQTFPMGEKVEVAFDDEIKRVFTELQQWRQAQLGASASTPTPIPKQSETVSTPHTSRRRPMKRAPRPARARVP